MRAPRSCGWIASARSDRRPPSGSAARFPVLTRFPPRTGTHFARKRYSVTDSTHGSIDPILAIRFHPLRDRQLRRDRRCRRSLLGRADRTVAAEFPHRRRPDADADRSRARHGQACRRRNQSRTRAARPAPRRRHYPRRARGDRRQARRAFSAGGLADRVRHPNQHEPQRGDRQSGQRNAGRQTRHQAACASERSRQYEPVVERFVPDRDAHRGGDADSPPTCFPRSPSFTARFAERKRRSPGSSRSAGPTPRMPPR